MKRKGSEQKYGGAVLEAGTCRIVLAGEYSFWKNIRQHKALGTERAGGEVEATRKEHPLRPQGRGRNSLPPDCLVLLLNTSSCAEAQ